MFNKSDQAGLAHRPDPEQETDMNIPHTGQKIKQDYSKRNSAKNESRLSRLPGMIRPEKNQWQRLLWLCPEGGIL